MGGRPQGQFRQPGANQKYKTVKCKYFDQYGQCKYGDKCSFAHGDQELREAQMMEQSQMQQMPPMDMGGM